MEADIIQAVAEDGRVDLLAKWMGVLTRGGHARSASYPHSTTLIGTQKGGTHRSCAVAVAPCG